MPTSMTGFGRYEFKNDQYIIIVEIKSYNHRYLEFSFRFPRYLHTLEDKCKTILQEKIKRGKVEIFLQINEHDVRFQGVQLNQAIFDGYLEAIESLKEKSGLSSNPSLELLAGLPEVFHIVEKEIDFEEFWRCLKPTFEEALAQLVAMRKKESEKLFTDILSRLSFIEEQIEKIKERSPFIVEEYKTRIQKNLLELLPPDTVDEYQNRLLFEIVIFADKINTTEEIIRLQSHISQFKEYTTQDYPIGRKLDFLLQEINREINTIGSKANDYELSKCVVEIKSELEKIREQIQNIE